MPGAGFPSPIVSSMCPDQPRALRGSVVRGAARRRLRRHARACGGSPARHGGHVRGEEHAPASGGETGVELVRPGGLVRSTDDGVAALRGPTDRRHRRSG